jgi:uncharacterized membrane protein
MHSAELKVLAAVLIGEGVPAALTGWDGAIEISECVDDGGEVFRVEDDPEAAKGRETFWSVYAHQTEGGVDCIADLRTEKEAEAFAAGLLIARQFYTA